MDIEGIVTHILIASDNLYAHLFGERESICPSSFIFQSYGSYHMPNLIERVVQ